MYYQGKYKYGLLYDGTIVRIRGWIEVEEGEAQDVYFYYRCIDKVISRRESAFAFHYDFYAYSNSVRWLKRIYRKIKRLRKDCC